MSNENDISKWQAQKLRARLQRADVVFAQYPRKDGTFPTDENENTVLIKGAGKLPEAPCMRIFLPSLDACHALQLFFEPEQSPHRQIANLVDFAEKTEALDIAPLELFQRLTSKLSATPGAGQPPPRAIQEAQPSIERSEATTAAFDKLASPDWFNILPTPKSRA